MKKIPTLFERVFENHKKVGIKPNVTEGMEWVLNGEGVATVKLDGSCCAIINGEFYKRYDAKKGKKAHTPGFDATVMHYLAKYLQTAKNAPACEADSKLEKASVYVEGLLTNGGPSTDIFKKGIGEERTAELFRNVLFGTGK